MEVQRRWLVVFAVLMLAVLACTCGGQIPDLSQYLPSRGPTPVVIEGGTAPGPRSCPPPGIVEMPPYSPPDESLVPPEIMAEALLAADIPPFDPYEWAAREGSIPYDAPRTTSGTRAYQVGDVETFMVGDRWTQAEAELVAMSEHAYFWVETGHIGDRDAYQRAAELFEQAYPIEQRYFGSEQSPGVDGDPRIFILHASGIDALGFFSPPDQVTQAVDASSNEHEMVYMSLDNVGQIGGDLYMATLTHEFQHMIQSNNDPNEMNWVDEGLAQMAELLTGYPGYAEDRVYLRNTGVPLNYWNAYGDDGPSYAANFLFWLYLWEQLGDDFFNQAAHDSGEGLMAVEETLQAFGSERDMHEVFSDWTVANLADDTATGDGRYGYDNFEAGDVCPLREIEASSLTELSIAIDQFTPHYYRLSGGPSYSMDFTGTTTAALVPAEAHSGLGFWWSNRRDASHTRLMREFDLTGLSSATLRYSVWYEVESDYDAMFVSASTDGGATWQALYGDHMHGTVGEYGLLPGYTGSSGGDWITDDVDLTPYGGGPVLVSFDYATDVNYTLHGFALDDIEVPELGFYDDAEAQDEVWQAEGWVWTGNQVPQHWGLYVVLLGDAPTVTPISVVDGRARIEGDFPPGATEVILVVAASAPITRVPAVYSLGPAQ
jgi:immune inhibitor A